MLTIYGVKNKRVFDLTEDLPQKITADQIIGDLVKQMQAAVRKGGVL